MDKESFNKIFDKIGNIDFSKFIPPTYDLSQNLSNYSVAELAKGKSAIGEVIEQIETQNQLASQQIHILLEQNKLLSENYVKLQAMYDSQEKSYSEAKEDLKRSRAFNAWMMVIAVIAMFAAIAGPIATVWVS